MEAWSLRYYDQHGEPNGLGIALANPPAYMQATHHPTGKELRYYAEGEQRYQQLEQVARELYEEAKVHMVEGMVLRGATPKEAADRARFYMSNQRYRLEALGVSLDG